MKHRLYETEDKDAPEQIKDRNGDVCLGQCRRCGRAEIQLTETPECDGFKLGTLMRKKKGYRFEGTVCGTFAYPNDPDKVFVNVQHVDGWVMHFRDDDLEPIKRYSVIYLTPAEIHSGYDRVQWAENLIRQLPKDHDGRNSWLLNFGRKQEDKTDG